MARTIFVNLLTCRDLRFQRNHLNCFLYEDIEQARGFAPGNRLNNTNARTKAKVSHEFTRIQTDRIQNVIKEQDTCSDPFNPSEPLSAVLSAALLEFMRSPRGFVLGVLAATVCCVLIAE